MPTTSALVKSALRHVDAHRISEELRAALDRERSDRQRFYDLVDENRKMEFINGKIVFQSPSEKRENEVTGRLFQLISIFSNLFDLGFTGVEKLLVSLTRNDYEPDVCFWLAERAKDFSDDQMQFPAPDFVAEVVSKSTEKVDRQLKFQDYAQHGVREYWIVSPQAHSIEQYQLVGEQFQLLGTFTEGTIKSFTIQGFEIPIEAVFNKKAILKALATLLGSQDLKNTN